jgi:ribonuclease HI
MLTGYTDGACRKSNPGECSCAFVIYDTAAHVLFEEGYYLGHGTNNFAEYEGLLHLLEYARAAGMKGIAIFCDSKLVVNQVNGIWEVNNPKLGPYRRRACDLILEGCHALFHIRGHQGVPGNEKADKICNDILDAEEKRK